MKAQTATPSTKTEILEAYNRLKRLAKQNKSSIQQLSQAKVEASVQEIEMTLLEKEAQLEALEHQIEELKEKLHISKKIVLTQEALEFLQDKFIKEQEDWESRKKIVEEELAKKATRVRVRLAKELEEKEHARQEEEQTGKKQAEYAAIKAQNEIFSSKSRSNVQTPLMTNAQND